MDFQLCVGFPNPKLAFTNHFQKLNQNSKENMAAKWHFNKMATATIFFLKMLKYDAGTATNQFAKDLLQKNKSADVAYFSNC